MKPLKWIDEGLRGLNLIGYLCWDILVAWLLVWAAAIGILLTTGCGGEEVVEGSDAETDAAQIDSREPVDSVSPADTTVGNDSDDRPGYILTWTNTTEEGCLGVPGYDRVDLATGVYYSSCGAGNVSANVVVNEGDPTTITILPIDLYDCSGLYADSLPQVTLNSWDDLATASGNHLATRRAVPGGEVVCTASYTQAWSL
jgi:hypothetical protein